MVCYCAWFQCYSNCSPLHPEDDVPTEQQTNQTTDNNDEKYECH